MNPEAVNIPRLPSQDAAIHLVSGDPLGIPESIGATLVRAAIISTGLLAAGYRGVDLARASIFGATAVELFVVGYTYYHVNKGRIK